MTSMPQTIPEGYTTVTPWIISRDTRALMAFLAEAFGAEDLGSLTTADGSIGHAEMRIGTGIVLMFDGRPHYPATPAFIRLYVEDAEALFAKAVAAGATPITRVTHLAFGDKVGRVRDPLGNLWWLQQRVEEISDEEMVRRWSDPEWASAMAYVQSMDLVS